MKGSSLLYFLIAIYSAYSREQPLEGCFLPDVDDCVRQFQGKQCYGDRRAFRDRCFACSCGPLQRYICWNYCDDGRPQIPAELEMDLCVPGQSFYRNRNTCRECICGYGGRKSLSFNCRIKPFCFHLGK